MLRYEAQRKFLKILSALGNPGNYRSQSGRFNTKNRSMPYRSEWKFDITAHKKILIDIGHVCQNLYLAGESIDAGTCAIGIYDQKMIDMMLELDGEEEFVIYLAAVGNKRTGLFS